MAYCDNCNNSTVCTLCLNFTFLKFDASGCVANCSLNDNTSGTMDDLANWKCVKTCPAGT